MVELTLHHHDVAESEVLYRGEDEPHARHLFDERYRTLAAGDELVLRSIDTDLILQNAFSMNS